LVWLIPEQCPCCFRTVSACSSGAAAGSLRTGSWRLYPECGDSLTSGCYQELSHIASDAEDLCRGLQAPVRLSRVVWGPHLLILSCPQAGPQPLRYTIVALVTFAEWISALVSSHKGSDLFPSFSISPGSPRAGAVSAEQQTC
jgi:hypothetical protein